MAPAAKPLIVTSSAPAGKRPRVAADLKKKAKSTTALIIQDAITKMSDNATSFISSYGLC